MESKLPIALEICVDSIESAINAFEGGADRLELCAALSEGGLTPTPSFLKVVKKKVHIPIYCMVRPRGGLMVYSANEREILVQEAQDLIKAGADGLVFGALSVDGKVDTSLCKELIKIANGLPCTFHRAFDLLQSPLKELDAVIELGFKRILTSGCKSSALEGSSLLKELVKRADGRLIILAGAGVMSDNCSDLVACTGVTEIHSSAKIKKIMENHGGPKHARMGNSDDDVVFVASADEVRKIKSNLNLCSS